MIGLRKWSRHHLLWSHFLAWVALITVATVLLALSPLTGVLGFEFCFVLSALVGAASANIAAATVRRQRTEHSRAGAQAAHRGPWRLLAQPIAINLCLLPLALTLIVANALRITNCDWGFGVVCFAALPVVTIFVWTPIGVACGLVTQRRWLSLLLPYAAVFVSLGVGIYTAYSQPPVAVYNALVGFFPGNLYDDHIQLQWALLWSRVYQLAIVMALFTLVYALRGSARGPLGWPKLLRRPLHFVALLFVTLAVALWWNSGTLGFSISADDLRRALSGRHETEHFVIHFEAGGVIERDIAQIAEEHEFRLAQVSQRLGASPTRKITSYYFADPRQKYRLLGARNVDMAKPWRREIYVNHDSFPHTTLRHEIAHVVAGEFGDPLFGVSAKTVLGLPIVINAGLIEGIAVAADWERSGRGLTPHQQVKAMRELGFEPPLAAILSAGFLQFSATQSYTAAGSFLRYLLDIYGAAKVQRFYRTGGDFDDAFGESQQAIISRWRNFVASQPLPPRAAEALRERFRRGGIFSRRCPRAIAKRRRQSEYLHAKGDFLGAARLAGEVCDDAPAEPRYRLELAARLRDAGSRQRAREILRSLTEATETVSATLRVRAFMELTRSDMEHGDLDTAKARLVRASQLPLDWATRRQLEAQKFAVNHAGPAGTPLRQYFLASNRFTGWDPAAAIAIAAQAIALEPNLGLPHYLLGRLARAHNQPHVARFHLSRALQTGLPHSTLAWECALQLAAAAYASEHEGSADLKLAIATLTATDMPTAFRIVGYDWQERAHWRATRRLCTWSQPNAAPTCR